MSRPAATPRSSQDDRRWRALTAPEALEALQSSPQGLTAGEAARRLGQYDRNELPLRRVVHRIRDVRVDRYHLMREFFRGGDALAEHAGELGADRLHSVSLAAGAVAVGRTLAQVDPAQDRVVVTALVREGRRSLEPAADTRLAAGDVLVLFGAPADLERAEARLTQPAAG